MNLVTGATGHIGNVLVRELLKRGEKVRVLILPGESLASLKGLEVEKVEGDVRDYDSLAGAFEGVRVVYHLAAIISIVRGMKDLMHEVNVGGVENVIRACRAMKVKKLIYTSSIHAFEEPRSGDILDETYSIDPEKVVGDYAKTKAEAALKMLRASKEGLDVRIVAPAGVIGPYDFGPSQMGQVFIDFYNRKLWTYIEGEYNFVDVRDVALGHILACEKGKQGEIYLLTGWKITLQEMMRVLEEVTGLRAPKFGLHIRVARFLVYFAKWYYRLTKTKPIFTEYSVYTLSTNSRASNKKAQYELGFSPRSLRESISDSLGWFKDNGMLKEKKNG